MTIIKNVLQHDGGSFDATERNQHEARSIIRAWSMLFTLQGNNVELGFFDVMAIASFANVYGTVNITKSLCVLQHWNYVVFYFYNGQWRYKLSKVAIEKIKANKK